MTLLYLVQVGLIFGFGIQCPTETESIMIPTETMIPKVRFGDKVKIAFYADVGITSNSKKVMEMTKNWGADLSIIAGDFDYEDNPSAFLDMFSAKVGHKDPLLVALGNHDILKWYEPKTGYQALFEKQAIKSKMNQYCSSELGVKQYCVFDGMVFVLSGIGTMGSGHVEFINTVFTEHNHVPWKFCVWHKNQRNLQTGDKVDETGYEVYEECRKHGAMVITGHEHSYARTHLLSNYENQTVASTNNHLELRPGVSFATVAGLGGIEIRGWRNNRQSLSHWAATAALDNGVNYGALLCTFHLKENHAKCSFRDIDGVEWDNFTLSSTPGIVTDVNVTMKSKELPLLNHFSKSDSDVLDFNHGEHYLEFELDVPPTARIEEAHLQLLLMGEKDIRSTVSMSIGTIGTSAKFIHQESKRVPEISATIHGVDKGHVWNSPNLATMIQPFTNFNKVILVLKTEMEDTGLAGFFYRHPVARSCVAPTLFVSYK